MIAYGPVPSRRLGRSLGVNNIPPKACTYACAYCQVGHTLDMSLERREFYPPEEIARAVGERLEEVDRLGEVVDYLSFVPDGEPTLDINLGRAIALLRPLGRKIAVITNATLLTRPDVCEELATADWVSLKIDAVEEAAWRRVNHPNKALSLPAILESTIEFKRMFRGELVTETMLLDGVNDTEEQATATAAFLAKLGPDKSYLSIPTRPPALDWARPPGSEAMVRCHEIFEQHGGVVEYLMGYEGNEFSTAGDPRENLLGITAVHPMRRDAVEELLARMGAEWALVEELLADGSLREVEFGGHAYYLRRPRRD